MRYTAKNRDAITPTVHDDKALHEKNKLQIITFLVDGESNILCTYKAKKGSSIMLNVWRCPKEAAK